MLTMVGVNGLNHKYYFKKQWISKIELYFLFLFFFFFCKTLFIYIIIIL